MFSVVNFWCKLNLNFILLSKSPAKHVGMFKLVCQSDTKELQLFAVCRIAISQQF